MYGLTHRISQTAPAPSDTAENGALAPVIPLRAAGNVLVIDRDPFTLSLVRLAVRSDYHVMVARDADDALALIRTTRPDVVVFDVGLDQSEIAMVTVALAACDDLDSTPTIMLDHDQPVNADSMRARIDAAVKVTRRVYLGGGLRGRMAA